MDIDASIEQVAGILHRAELKFDTRPDGKAYRLLFVGGEAVFIDFDRWGDDSVLITVSSPALDDIEADSIGAAIALNRLNELNGSHRFVKYLLADGTLMVATDLLGDTLQAGELLNVVFGVAGAAREVVEQLQPEVGGLRHCEKHVCVAEEDPDLYVDFEDEDD